MFSLEDTLRKIKHRKSEETMEERVDRLEITIEEIKRRLDWMSQPETVRGDAA